MNRLQQVQERLRPLKAALLNHPIYQEIDRLDSLRLFMEHHVFAVWDFMSLLKALQRRLCCVEVPWLPAADPLGCRLVNEIVLAEESDDDGRGGFASHFDLYHRAMTRCGANTATIDGFLGELRRGQPVATALESAWRPRMRPPVSSGRPSTSLRAGTFAASPRRSRSVGKTCCLRFFNASWTQLNVEAGGGLEDFKYYLDRHIGLDGDEHGPMANRLLLSLCGSEESRWQVAEQAAVDCLEARRGLWDGICDAIRQKKNLAQ